MVTFNSAASFSNNSINDFQRNEAPASNVRGQFNDCTAKEMAQQGNVYSGQTGQPQSYDPNCKPAEKYAKPYQGGNTYESYSSNPYAQMMKQKMQQQCVPVECAPVYCAPPQTKTEEPKMGNMDKMGKMDKMGMDKAKECNPSTIESPKNETYKELNKVLKGLEKSLDSLTGLLKKENKILSKLENITSKLTELVSKLTDSKTPSPGNGSTPTTGAPSASPTPGKEGGLKEQLGQLLNQIKSLITELGSLLKGEPKGDVNAKPKPTPAPAPDKGVKEPGNDLNQQTLKLVLEALELAVSVISKLTKPDDGIVTTTQNAGLMASKTQMMA
jgi:hypothetical protein